jgi:hypothetical protein
MTSLSQKVGDRTAQRTVTVPITLAATTWSSLTPPNLLSTGMLGSGWNDER